MTRCVQTLFLPVEFLATTHSMGPSVCNYYNYRQEDMDYIRTSWRDIVNNETGIEQLQVSG